MASLNWSGKLRGRQGRSRLKFPGASAKLWRSWRGWTSMNGCGMAIFAGGSKQSCVRVLLMWMPASERLFLFPPPTLAYTSPPW
jgi:hypothetical protein